MPNSSAIKVACAIASSSPPISLCPSESYALLRFLARSATRLKMSRTLSPATSASSPCDGFAPRHYSNICIDGDEPDGEEHLLLQGFHGSRIGRVLVDVDHPGYAIAARAQGLAEEAFGP